MFDEIRNSYPPITAEAAGENHEFLSQLPDDYRRFLEAHNGGFVEESRYGFLTGVPFRTESADNPSRDDWPVEFFGIPIGDSPGDHPSDLLQQLVDHAAEGFLPRDVIAVARCSQSSLVCLSLREADHGCVYYWDWYWRYPWCRFFFDERIQAVLRAYPDSAAILEEAEHPLHARLQDDLNFATLVQLAPRFRAWFESCEDLREEESGRQA